MLRLFDTKLGSGSQVLSSCYDRSTRESFSQIIDQFSAMQPVSAEHKAQAYHIRIRIYMVRDLHLREPV